VALLIIDIAADWPELGFCCSLQLADGLVWLFKDRNYSVPCCWNFELK